MLRNLILSIFYLGIIGCAANKPAHQGTTNFSTWYGMYLKNEKVGYSEVKVEQKTDGYDIYELTYIELSMMGVKRNLKSISQYKTNSDFAIQSFTFNLDTEAQKIFARGDVKVETQNVASLQLAIKTGGETQTKNIPLTSPVYPITALPMLAYKFTKAGIEIQVFDPSIQAVNPATCKLLESTNDSIKVSVTMLNGISTAWVSKKEGKLLTEIQPMDVLVVEEPKDKAIIIKEVSPEILTLFSVKPDKKIENPRNVKLLKLKLVVSKAEPTTAKVVENEQQRWFGDTLLIETRGPMLALSAAPKGEVAKCLEPTPFIQCNDKKIIKLANEITAGSTDPWMKTEKLIKWVSENVRDMPTVSVPSALDVLASKEGDCGEHTILFVALARACKIPASEVVGLVYVGDGFYYHAWAKVWLGRWVEVDPTFGQPIADATHLALAEGGLEEQAKIMELVDKIKIEVLEYK